MSLGFHLNCCFLQLTGLQPHIAACTQTHSQSWDEATEPQCPRCCHPASRHRHVQMRSRAAFRPWMRVVQLPCKCNTGWTCSMTHHVETHDGKRDSTAIFELVCFRTNVEVQGALRKQSLSPTNIYSTKHAHNTFLAWTLITVRWKRAASSHRWLLTCAPRPCRQSTHEQLRQ